MKIHPLQNRFDAGILSPRMHLRSDIEGYQAGVKDMVNFVVLKQGPAKFRNGTIFIGEVAGSYARNFPFQLSPDSEVGEAFDIVISDDGNLYVIGATSAVLGAEVLTNTSFGSGLNGWEVTATGGASVNWVSGVTILEGGNNPSDRATISQLVTINPADVGNTFRLTYTTETQTELLKPDIFLDVGTTQNGTDIAQGIYRGFNDSLEFTPNTDTFWVTISANGVEEDPGSFEPNVTPVPRTTNRRLVKMSLADTVGEAQISFPHSYSATDISRIQTRMVPDRDEMYLVSGNNAPTRLEYNDITGVWSYSVIPFTSEPSEWGSGSYPSTLTFFQGRSWWGGVKNSPETFWGSKSAEYENLTIGSLDNEAIEYTIAQKGQIRWMEGIRNLVIGTNTAEYIVTAQDGLLTPSDVDVDMQSANGSDNIQSLPVGNAVIYVSSDGRKVYKSVFKWTEDSWFSDDLTFVAEHLTDGNRIVDMSFAKNPENIVWCTSEDGNLLAFTYEATTERAGWHRHETDGRVLGGTVLQIAGRSVFSMVVSRQVNGVSVLHVERMDPNTYVDDAAFIENETPMDEIQVEHLAGATVSLVVDGAVQPDIVLDSEGRGVLKYSGNSVVVGRPYKGTFLTLDADFGSQTGSARTYAKRWNKIFVGLYSSVLPLINGTRPPDRSPSTPMDTREPDKTEIVEVTNLGYSLDAPILIEHDLPLGMTITGILGELGQESL